jgi:hypothetical protein
MIATRRVLFEKEDNLFISVIKSQDKGKINDDTVGLLFYLCETIFNLKFSKYISNESLKEDMIYDALEFCIKKYDKFNREYGHKSCKTFFSTLAYHKMLVYYKKN